MLASPSLLSSPCSAPAPDRRFARRSRPPLRNGKRCSCCRIRLRPRRGQGLPIAGAGRGRRGHRPVCRPVRDADGPRVEPRHARAIHPRQSPRALRADPRVRVHRRCVDVQSTRRSRRAAEPRDRGLRLESLPGARAAGRGLEAAAARVARYGSTIFDVAKTAYAPIAAPDVKVAIVVESAPTPFIRRYAADARNTVRSRSAATASTSAMTTASTSR